MDGLEVLRRVEAGEDSRTEFKRGLGDMSAVGRTLCAFANGNGGLLVFGVDDRGDVVGVKENPRRVQERITGFLHTGCSAPVSAGCGWHEDRNGLVHWIEVPRQRGPQPFSYRGRFWIRRGGASVEPSPHERQELFNAFGFVLTEEQTIRSAGVDAIDFGAFRAFQRAQGLETQADPQPSIEDDLLNAGVVDRVDRALRPTLYGLMAFGRDPQAHPHTRSHWIQCTAYAGRDRASDVILAGDGKGRLDEQVRRALGWIASLGRTESWAGIVRKDRPSVPELALREALVNAVIHRDYAVPGALTQLETFDNRIDVTSPGTLPNHMTVESVLGGGRVRSRNEAMAHAMVVAGLMERRGRGWPSMRHAMRAFNGTEPELVNDEGGRFVRVTFRLDADAARGAE